MDDETLKLHFKTIEDILAVNRKEHDKLFTKMNTMAIDIATLKVKSGIWGFIAGVIPATCMFMYLYIKGKM